MRFFCAPSRLVVCLLLGCLPWRSAKADVITFEELPLGASGFYNGNTGASNNLGWTSQGVFFNNNYSSDFGGFWDGWSYSNVANSTTAGFTNQYAAWPGGGSQGNGTAIPGQKYAVGYGSGAYFNIPAGSAVTSLDLANTTYAALSMRNGDGFSKRFGGASGNDPDFFRITLTGYSNTHKGGNPIGSVVVNLADFSFQDNSQDYILSAWHTVSLQSLASSRSIGISFDSSDVGQFGINTPTYVALDNLHLVSAPEPGTLLMLGPLAIASAALMRIRKLTSKKRPSTSGRDPRPDY
jgi:hypothetical protein